MDLYGITSDEPLKSDLGRSFLQSLEIVQALSVWQDRFQNYWKYPLAYVSKENSRHQFQEMGFLFRCHVAECLLSHWQNFHYNQIVPWDRSPLISNYKKKIGLTSLNFKQKELL